MRLFGTVDGVVDEQDRAFFGFAPPFDKEGGAAGFTQTGYINHVQVTAGAVDAFSWIAPPRRFTLSLKGR